ncbi:CNNM domain-containing protein [Spongiibacter sp.]|uniref:CNNM domain-containing protein n=1 Tax=Spongiibacter sp. TaxID=2024860 RepID=UPI00356434AE
MAVLALYILLALGVSFLCSLLEAVLLSVNSSYIAAGLAKGQRSARWWQNCKDDIDKPLAAILSLNTIAHTVGAAGAGAQATKLFGEVYFGVISAVLTLLILVFSEIIPKTLGARYWRQLAPACAVMLHWVQRLMAPLVWLTQWVTLFLSRKQEAASVSRDEFAALAELGVEEGVFSPREARAVRSLLRFSRTLVRDVMSPRPVIFSLDGDSTVEQVLAENRELPFSRIPIYREQPDNVFAFVRKDEILRAAIDAPGTVLHSLQRPLLIVPDNLPLRAMIQKMLVPGKQMALAVGEYGELHGLVTTEDLVETLLGFEITDETDPAVDMQVFARQRWEQRARQIGFLHDEVSHSGRDKSSQQ